jgi:methylated-DNA-[protein]-cysteine S-methyltransferase
MTMKVTRSITSPLGDLLLVGEGETLHGIYFEGHRPIPQIEGAVPSPDAFGEAVRQLGEWFAGTRTTFDLDIELQGSDFQRRVWAALREIPFGETVSYGHIAEAAGMPGAARAAGSAIGRNPVSIIVPCHRVVGANGSLTGYAGGMDRKRALLDHERGIRPFEAMTEVAATNVS